MIEKAVATILVVDDSPVSRHLLSYTLKRKGHRVISLACGYEALDVLATEAVELVIVDLQMPGMDGLTLLKHIRSSERMGKIQLLMLTASGSDHDREAAQAAGVNGFLTKPASSHDLIAAVDLLIQRSYCAL